MLLIYINKFFNKIQKSSFYYRHSSKYIMLDLPYFIKKKVNNLIIKIKDLLFNLKLV